MRILLLCLFVAVVICAAPSEANQIADAPDPNVGEGNRDRWNWDVLVKAIAAAGAGAAWTYQWRGRHRGKLKADLEILEAYKRLGLDPESVHCKNLGARIERRMGRLYPDIPLLRRDIDWSDLSIGLFCLGSAVILLFFAAGREAANQEWYYIAAASLALAGGAGVYKGVERKLGQL